MLPPREMLNFAARAENNPKSCVLLCYICICNPNIFAVIGLFDHRFVSGEIASAGKGDLDNARADNGARMLPGANQASAMTLLCRLKCEHLELLLKACLCN